MGEIRHVANACPAGEHGRRQCSFFLGFPVYGIKLFGRLLRSSMEQSPLPHSAPTCSFAEGIFFWLGPPTIFAEFEFDRGF
jgi:hypothetical protein